MAPLPARVPLPALLASMLAAAIAAPSGCEKAATESEEPVMTFPLTSPAFGHNQRIPVKHTGEGADTSPPLEWGDPPAGAAAFALVCDDPDAPAGTWDHWLIWNIPAAARRLPEGVSKTDGPPEVAGAIQGNNSWPKIGYYGPMPPRGHGTHHYNFTLYALSRPLDLPAGSDKKALLAAMKGAVVGKATLTGTYSR